MKTSETPPAALFDPWADAYENPHSSDPDDPTTPPIGWVVPIQASRECVGAAIHFGVALPLQGIQAGPDGRAHRARWFLRAHVTDARELGIGPEAATFAGLYVRDAKERARWQKAADDLQLLECRHPFVLLNAIRKLQAAGDTLALLRRRRADLDAQIAALEKRQGSTR